SGAWCSGPPTPNADPGDRAGAPGAGRVGRRREFRTADATSLHYYGTVTNCAFPGRLSEPGPGRSASPSSARLPVGGVQKLLTGTAGCGRPSVRSPAGEPFCVITTAVTPGIPLSGSGATVVPNAPACPCAGQNSPSGVEVVIVDEVSGLRLIGSVAT